MVSSIGFSNPCIHCGDQLPLLVLVIPVDLDIAVYVLMCVHAHDMVIAQASKACFLAGERRGLRVSLQCSAQVVL